MALIECYECGRQISDSATSCPGCGAPIRTRKYKKGDILPYTEQEVAVLLSKKKKTNHILHLFLSLLTGVWVIIWIAVTVTNSSENAKIDRQIINGKKI